MPDDPSFEELLARLRHGDESAATAVYNRFCQRLIALARCRLDQRLRQKVDPEDVVQSAFKSFFPRHAEGQFDGYDLHNWDSLWGLLVVITLRKCSRKIDHFFGPKHDLRREKHLTPPQDSSVAGWEALAAGPTPDEEVQLIDLVEQTMRQLDPRERQVLQLRLQGCTVAEVAAQMDRSEFTVQYILRRIRKRLERLRDQDDPHEPA
jgi:RNA polymerase sigma-70 factor (ECF subfamily)